MKKEVKREVFIIGGGASLKGFPFGKLKDKETIAVNVAAFDVPNPTYCITADSGIFRKLQEGYFKGIDTTWVVVSNPEHTTMKWRNGRFIHSQSKFVYNLFAPNMIIRNAGTDGIGLTFKDFKTGYNSGFCGFQLAVLLGYERIYLLGFDLATKPNSHYHDRYGEKGISTITFERYYKNFKLALQFIRDKTDIEVISCSSVSRLNDMIPYQSFGKVQEESPPQKEREATEIISYNLLDDVMHETKKRLSILICSIKGRERLLKKLMCKLDKQRIEGVEILVESDNRKISIGAKRNILLRKAKGDYVVFIDDDDDISDNYISKILKAISSNPDCVGVEGEVFFRKKNRRRKFIHSLRYESWFERDNVYYRCPNHISPVKRELALQVMFSDKSKGEDKEYSLKLHPLLKSEVCIKGPIYYYLTG